MKIVFIVYAVSWIVLLIVYACSAIKEKKTNLLNEKNPWYLYLAIVMLAPLAVLLIPYIIIDGYREEMKRKRNEKELETQKRIENEHRDNAKSGFIHASLDRKSIKATSEQIAIGGMLINLVKRGNYNKFLSILDKLSLPKGCVLEVDMAKQTGIGDKSRLFVKKASSSANYDYFKDIIVEDSSDGAWQAYLLYSLWHVLPTFWHGGYDTRTYLFSKQDLKDLRTFEKEDQEVIEHLVNYDLIPEVVKSSYNDKYYVTCCYWSDWGGLIRELVEITIDKNKVIDVFKVQQTVEFEYDCGILF